MDKKGKYALIGTLAIVLVLAMSFALAKPPAKACRDGNDNDGDGLTDWPADPGCSSKNDQTETTSAYECDNGLDDDSDGNVDTADTGCSSPTDTDETNCGDNVCEGGETSLSCPQDCGYPDSCADSDGGFVTGTAGTTSGYFMNNPYSYSDSCATGTVLIEHYCSGVYHNEGLHDCSINGTTNGTCSNGACI